MKRTYFGTDGVRGTANTHPMTAEMALKLGAAVGRYFRKDKKEHRVVIGKDTRQSSYMIENALMAGFMSTGMNVFPLGPVPTPAVGMLTRSMRADVGVMISASHNHHFDNGIKFFDRDGFKLSDQAETEIEALIDGKIDLCQPQYIGKAKRIDDALGRYMEFAKTTFASRRKLDGLKVVVDCANGAAYKAAPTVLWEMGAEVITTVGCSPNGANINESCGSTDPANAIAAVLEHGADIGICFDGDADRLILIDEKGCVADGDQLMALIASHWAREGRLTHNTLVSTVMSNMGMERYLTEQGITVLRTDVGDRYVVGAMRDGGFNLGGEQSGHIVMTDYATTGDGLIAALQFLAVLVQGGARASDVLRVFAPMPQLLKNVRYTRGQSPLQTPAVKDAIKAGEAALGQGGRLLVRASGTEPVLRVMGESDDAALLERVVGEVASALVVSY
ncbi:MAG: phosphoglucosamine mutase [Candidatus Halichondribacter symbioticus]